MNTTYMHLPVPSNHSEEKKQSEDKTMALEGKLSISADPQVRGNLVNGDKPSAAINWFSC